MNNTFKKIFWEAGLDQIDSAEDLVVIMAILNVDHYVHLEHTKIANNKEVYELLHQVNWFLTRASKQAAKQGFDFTPIAGKMYYDSMSQARKKCLEFEHWYRNKGYYSPKQRSYILSLINKVQKMLAVYEDEEVLAIIKTQAGFLEISQKDDKLYTKLVSIDQAKDLLALTEISYEPAEIVDTELALLWDLSWLDESTPTISSLQKASNDSIWKMFFSIEVVNKLAKFIGQVNGVLERYQHASSENWQKSQEIYHEMKMSHDFRVKIGKEEKVRHILIYLSLNSQEMNNAKIQHEVNEILQELFGGVFDAFAFLKALATI